MTATSKPAVSAAKSESIELKLLGQRIALKSQGEPARVAEVVALATRKIQEAERRLKSSSVQPQHVALLALLDLAEDLLAARQNVADFRDAVAERAEPLLRFVAGDPTDSADAGASTG